MAFDVRATGTNTAEPWTWADQLSSYRYWGLALASLCSYLANMCWTYLGHVRMSDELGIPASTIGVIYSMWLPAAILAFYFAWAVSRSRPVGALLTACAVQLAGALLLSLATSVWLLFSGALLFQAAQLAFVVGTPVALSGARSGARHFVVAYGVVWLLHIYGQGILSAIPFGDRVPLKVGLWAMPVLLVAALALLAPVPRALFSSSPGRRDQSLDPVRREPVVVALLTFVPFYAFYWLYRAHGEAARLAPSRGLLTPPAAVTVSVLLTVPPAVLTAVGDFLLTGSRGSFSAVALAAAAAVPFILPVLLATLMDELNAGAATRGSRRLGSPAGVFFWGVFFPPVGLALGQAALNRLGAQAPAISQPRA